MEHIGATVLDAIFSIERYRGFGSEGFLAFKVLFSIVRLSKVRLARGHVKGSA
jgi:hypothetical protein